MRSLIIILLSFLVLGACSNEEDSLNKKIIQLEDEVELYRERFLTLYGNTVESCSTYQDEISTFGPYSLTQTTTDQDWDCINKFIKFV